MSLASLAHLLAQPHSNVPPRSVLTSAYTYWRAHSASLGGLYVASRLPLVSAAVGHGHGGHHGGGHSTERFTRSETASRKGISVTEVDVSGRGWKRVRRLLVFNTHLDVGPGTALDPLVHRAHHHSQQPAQIQQLRQTINRVLREKLLASGGGGESGGQGGGQGSDENTANAANNANTTDSLEHIAVLLVGDYNMIAGSDLYRERLLPLRGGDSGGSDGDGGGTDGDGSTPAVLLRDLWPSSSASDANQQPDQQPDQDVATYDAHTNPLATDVEASGRIDYILTIDQWPLDDDLPPSPSSSSSSPPSHSQPPTTHRPTRMISLGKLCATRIRVWRDASDPVASDHYPVQADIIPCEDWHQ